MRLSSVIAGTGAAGPGGPDLDVTAVTADSREVRAGSLFFAIAGGLADGHLHAAAAAARGAVAVVAERPVECAPARLLLAPSTRRALAVAAANLLGRPGDALRLGAVTGTNGKTTVAHLVDAAARAAGVPAAMLGTIVHRLPGGERPATHTTPGAPELQALLAAARDGGARLAVMEVSSHALAQERVAGLRFAAAAFTNLTRDHLDYHRDMEGYFAAKRRLFTEHLAPDGIAIVNVTDPWGARLADQLGPGRRVWRYGGRGDDDLRAAPVSSSMAGLEARVATPAGPLELRSPLVGAHNLENLLCAAGLALALGLPPGAVAAGLSGCPGAPGRLERIGGGPVAVFVDYAHTDDALARAIEALRGLAPRRLVVLFGCGGDRDRGKRPLMGEAAGRGGELVVVTSDNPRREPAGAIIDEILPGLERAGRRRLDPAAAAAGADGYLVEPDRRAAIALAVGAARPGDAVLLAGKGHETVQIVGEVRHHLDDREEARRALGLA